MILPVLPFGGATYDPAIDGPRLTTQYGRVLALMADGRWRTLSQITAQAGGSEAGVSARLRDLRKAAFAGRTVERRRVAGGLWEYRMLANARAGR